MSIPIETSHMLLLATGEAPAIVRVKNIQSTIQGPSDAWGRPNQPQPISVSVTVGMARSFGPTSTSDALASDTVHYGLLSKAVLATLTRLNTQRSSQRPLTLPCVLDNIWGDLTGVDTAGLPGSPVSPTPFLPLDSVKSLQVELRLPKATLQGSGVCLTATGVFGGHGAMTMRGITLTLCELRIPILIGLNPNERRAKQAVVANVHVDRFDEAVDSYCALEDVIAKTMTNSASETIEALLADMALHITAHLADNHKQPADGKGWQLTIAVEKPMAVVFADAPCVQVRINTNEMISSAKDAQDTRKVNK